LWNCIPLLPHRSLHLFLISWLVLPAVAIFALSTASTSQLDSYQVRLTGEA
jgi:hypothetical protein